MVGRRRAPFHGKRARPAARRQECVGSYAARTSYCARGLARTQGATPRFTGLAKDVARNTLLAPFPAPKSAEASFMIASANPEALPMAETRKIAAILVADVVGYSRLAGADEEGTLARLRALRSDLIDPAIAAHHGRVVKRTGDGSSRRVPQRRRRGALRDRGAERHGRAQRGRAARASASSSA